MNALDAVAKLAGDDLVCIERPDEVFTTQEYARHVGISDPTARQRLKALEVSGKVTSMRFKFGANKLVVTGWRLNAETSGKKPRA